MDNILQRKKNENKMQDRSNLAGGLRINTKGLNLAGNVVVCNEGMSPLMERFNARKSTQ